MNDISGDSVPLNTSEHSDPELKVIGGLQECTVVRTGGRVN